MFSECTVLLGLLGRLTRAIPPSPVITVLDTVIHEVNLQQAESPRSRPLSNHQTPKQSLAILDYSPQSNQFSTDGSNL